MATTELGSVKLPSTTSHRVVGVGATYLDAVETIGPDGKPTVVYVSKAAFRGEEVELNAQEARRLIALGTVKEKDEPLSYDEQKVEDLQKLADERGLTVAGSGADGGVLKDDLINALLTYDRGLAVSGDAASASSAPGGVTVVDAKTQSGRRA